MERMGYGNQPYIVFKHKDIERQHLHIVSLRVDENGHKLPHDFEARRSMEILRDLECKYDLHPSIKGEEQTDKVELHRLKGRQRQTTDFRPLCGSACEIKNNRTVCRLLTNRMKTGTQFG